MSPTNNLYLAVAALFTLLFAIPSLRYALDVFNDGTQLCAVLGFTISVCALGHQLGVGKLFHAIIIRPLIEEALNTQSAAHQLEMERLNRQIHAHTTRDSEQYVELERKNEDLLRQLRNADTELRGEKSHYRRKLNECRAKKEQHAADLFAAKCTLADRADQTAALAAKDKELCAAREEQYVLRDRIAKLRAAEDKYKEQGLEIQKFYMDDWEKKITGMREDTWAEAKEAAQAQFEQEVKRVKTEYKNLYFTEGVKKTEEKQRLERVAQESLEVEKGELEFEKETLEAEKGVLEVDKMILEVVKGELEMQVEESKKQLEETEMKVWEQKILLGLKKAPVSKKPKRLQKGARK